MKDGGYSEKLEREMNMEFTKAGVLAEVNQALDNGLITEEQLLNELLLGMTNVELKDNWEWVKRNWDIDDEDLD